jgi:hypothetical protein
VPRFNQPTTILKASAVQGSGDDDADGPPTERTWLKPRETRDSDSDGEDFETNPFNLPRVPKEKVVVLHPGVAAHMSAMTRGRRNTLGRGMSPAQKELLKSDFLKGMDFWESTWIIQNGEMWRALEASRYSEANPEYGRADVDLAVKLLVPMDVAESPEILAKTTWSVRPAPHREGTETFNTKFIMVPCDAPSAGTPRNRAQSPALSEPCKLSARHFPNSPPIAPLQNECSSLNKCLSTQLFIVLTGSPPQFQTDAFDSVKLFKSVTHLFINGEEF